MSADSKARTYGHVLADRLAAETPGVLNVGDMRLPPFTHQPLQAWNGSVWEDMKPTAPIARPSVGDLRSDPSPMVWTGDQWVAIPDPAEDRLLADVLRRFIKDSVDGGSYTSLRDDEVVLDGYVTVNEAERAVLTRLIGDES